MKWYFTLKNIIHRICHLLRWYIITQEIIIILKMLTEAK